MVRVSTPLVTNTNGKGRNDSTKAMMPGKTIGLIWRKVMKIEVMAVRS